MHEISKMQIIMNNALLIRKQCKFIYIFLQNVIEMYKLDFEITFLSFAIIPPNITSNARRCFLIDPIS